MDTSVDALRARGDDPPAIVDLRADRVFRDLLQQLGMDYDDRFEGGYVAYEWAHARHVFDNTFFSVAGAKALEFGCHLGATACVLAALGAEVIGVDPDELAIQAARANAARHGLSARATFLHAPDTTQLPFEAASFDLVSCISVLEYVDPGSIHAIQREIDRVLRPGGHFVLYATGNRLWPLETHHRRWLVNYLPPEVDRVLFGRPVRRGVWPWEVRRGLPDYLDRSGEDGGRRLVEVKARQGLPTSRLLALRAVNRVLGPLGLHHGYVTPNLSMVLQKPVPA